MGKKASKSKTKSRTKKGASASRKSSEALKFLKRANTAVRSHLSATTDLRTFLASAGGLTIKQRRLLVEQAQLLIENNYVHRPLKEAMHGVDPVQRLRLIRHRLDNPGPDGVGSEFEFHSEMVEVFTSVRDLHTNYLLPPCR